VNNLIAEMKGLSKAVMSARVLKGVRARGESQIAGEAFIEFSEGLP
jgi:hypothetical protein